MLSNGGPVIVEPHPDDRMTYVQWHIRDYLTGVRQLKPDQVGIYSIILCLIYDRMGALPDDDRLVAAHCQCEVRYYRKIRATLIEAGKIYVADGYIYNNRVMSEIAKFCEQAKVRREAAAKREEQKRKEAALRAQQEAEMQAQLRAQQVPDYVQSHTAFQPEMHGQLTCRVPDARLTRTPYARHGSATGSSEEEKTNKNNGPPTTAVPEPSKYKERDYIVRDSVNGEVGVSTDRQSLELPLSDFCKSDDLSDDEGPKRNHLYSEAFQTFWKAYPETKGMSKLKAWQRWSKLSTSDRRLAFDALPAFKAHLADMRRTNPKLTCLHAEGYLHQRRFETLVDEAGVATDDPWWTDEVKVQSISEAQWRTTIERHANGIWPVPKLGPPPGSPRCIVPSRIVADMRLTEIYTDAGIKR